MNLKKAYLFLFALLIATLLIFVCLLFTLIIGYEESLSILIDTFNYQVYSDKIKLLLSENKFRYLQIFLSIQIAFLGVLIKYYAIVYSKIVICIQDLRNSLIQLIKNLSNLYVLLILVLPLSAALYFAFSLPISGDEAYTFVNFTSRNIFVALSYYPAPNNHILHSLLTNILYHFFPSFPLLSLRLPTLITYIFTLLVSFSFLRKHYNSKIAILVTAIFPVLFMSIYYAYMSRGYQLVMLFFILSLHFSYNIKNCLNNNNQRDWFWLIIFSILGFLTMPSYLYAYAIINIVLLINTNKYNFQKQIKSIIITLIGVIILYLPTIIVSGLASLINNKYVVPISRDIVISKLPIFFINSMELMFGLSYFVPISMIFISIIMLFKNKDWFNLKLAFIFLILPPLLQISHSVLAYPRTFNYYAFIIVMLFVISIRGYIAKINTKSLIVVSICIQALFVYNFKTKIEKYEIYSLQSNLVVSEIIKDNKIYTVNSIYFDAYLLYALKTSEKVHTYKFKYYPGIKMNADTIVNSDYIIIDKNIDETKNKNTILTNDFVNVYSR